MDIIFYLRLTSISLLLLLIFLNWYIEKKYDESHPIMKWWRLHVIGLDPDQINPKDDIYK